MTPARTYLSFERPVAELDSKIEDLVKLSTSEVDVDAEITQLRAKSAKQLESIYFSDYCKALVTQFSALAGDRKFGDDSALIGGLGKIDGHSVVILGHEKGKDTQTRVKHNWGMAQPEGYRKAVRLMELAERFSLPVISFVDTAGAFPGRGAEERGQAEAIARSIDKGLSLRVPFISIIAGEGGSGGAVAIATADSVMMLEHSIYSVISPEGCASILWRDSAKAKDAAKAMKITASDLKTFGIIDRIIEEPIGGAHRAPEDMIRKVGKVISEEIIRLKSLSPEALIEKRRAKFLNIGRSLLN